MISVVLATYNEEKNLAQCLSSVEEFADQIVVVDGSSADGTVRIAKQFGAEVINTTNKSNFHINKQMAMDAAKGNLVLQLDADEVVDDQLQKFIISVHKDLRTSQPITVAWYIARKNYLLDRFLSKGGQYPDGVIRLYLNGHARLPQQNVHEQMEVDGQVDWADGHILHFPYPSFRDYMRKFNTYTSFEAERIGVSLLPLSAKTIIRYLIMKPIGTFWSLFLRHRGYVDGMAGFVFALMSGFHHPFVLIKIWELSQQKS